MKLIDFCQKGLLQEYRRTWQLQKALSERVCGVEDGYLILVEHSPVYTSGKRLRGWSGSEEAQRLRQMGADTVDTDRGGLLTFHGPGQLVAYPVLDVSTVGLRTYVQNMERILLDTCTALGLKGMCRFGEAGVAVDGRRKVGFIGVSHARGKVMHGASLNVSVDLGWFQQIVPCGHVGLQITNIKDECASEVAMGKVKAVYKDCFEQIFKVKLHSADYHLNH